MRKDDGNNIQMVIIDLDGTLLNNEKKIGVQDYQTLEMLGKHGVIRVFATGRNLYSANKVLDNSFPFDYLVFSSGAGVLEWKTKTLLFKSHLANKYVVEIEQVLKKMNLNFSIQFPIPDNHKYFYYTGNNSNTDFSIRNEIYKDFIFELKNSYPFDYATQFVIILNHESEIKEIIKHLNGYKAIRATSPIDGKSVWLEIFNTDVSKALGSSFICKMLEISPKKTLGIGNDYNDLDLLEWAAHSYVVSNAPDFLKNKYQQCANNQNNPLSDVVLQIFR